METPETIRISLQQGEWVTSLDFSDACFHIPVHDKSRKYLRFHFQNQSYQFRALPFGLSTAPMEFTCVVKEVKLMAQSRGIRRVPESLEKEIPVPRSLHPHLLWWTKEANVLLGQPLHPLHHAIQIFTDASKEGWGAHLGDFTASGTWRVPESHLHINFLELKAVLLALKRFQHLVQGKVVLVATDNTTVVAYINKEGGMRSGSLCALLW